jgi:hypothetical protein
MGAAVHAETGFDRMGDRPADAIYASSIRPDAGFDFMVSGAARSLAWR